MSTRQNKGNQKGSQTPVKEDFDSKPAATEATDKVKEEKPSIDPDFIRAIFAEQLEHFFASKGPVYSIPPPSEPQDTFADSEMDLENYFSKNDPPSRNAKGLAPNPRRLTMTEREINGAEDAKVQVQFTKPQPKFDHIRLEKLRMPDMIKFIDDVIQYQTSFHIKLPISTLLSNEVRDILIAHNAELNDKKFYELRLNDLLSYLYKEVRPDSKIRFRRALQKNARFENPSGFSPYKGGFKSFYTALLTYKRQFIRTYEILATDNEGNVPKTDNKAGGLIKVFLEPITYGYGHCIYELLKDQEETFKDIYSFISAFYREVELDYARSEHHRTFLTHFSGTATALSARQSGRDSDELGNIAPVLPDQSDDLSFDETELELLADDDASSREFGDFDDPDDGELDPSDMHGGDDPLPPQPPPLANVQQTRPFSKPPPFAKGATRPSEHTSNYRSGCLTKLLRGECKNPGCQHSHRVEDLEQLRLSLSKKLSADRKSPSQAGGLHSILHLVNAVEEDVNPRGYHEKHNDFIQWMYLNDAPAANLFEAVHHKGTILVSENVIIDVTDVLFDSGAVQGSYVSEAFVRKNRRLLVPYRVKCRNRVKLADNETIVDLTEAYFLPMRFIDRNDSPHIGTALFWVLPTCSHDMIVGLPAIVMRFSELHKQMIDSAVAKIRDTEPTPAVNNLESSDDLRYPWTVEIEDAAPEDSSTELPSSFPNALHFMEMSVEDAEKEYLSLFEKHVHPDFAGKTDVLNLLRTKGLRVFVPSNWEGIKGVDPIKLNWKATLPESMKPRARPINPKLYQHAKKEFDRLNAYFYEPSDSPWASCLVIAPKATEPFIRFCGDYVDINKHIMVGHYPIPNVLHSLSRIIKYQVFVDLDLANSFHQFLLHDETKLRLSIQTPWGQFQPKFLPEGVGPASFILQEAMVNMFGDFEEWLIVIFDNMLILAHDYDDAYQKLEKVLDKCIEHNLTLKFKKSWLGFPSANFFGYVCKAGTYELSQDRIAAVQDIPFPKSTKGMQSFLGTILFFKPFIPNFSNLTARLNDMTHKDFNWDPASWTCDYHSEFLAVKQALLHPNVLHYPDFSLEWILRTDASTYGVGGILLQKRKSDDGSSETLEPIAYVSQKFSSQAMRWSTIEQEAYAMYYCVRTLSYYLHGKDFVLETDHNNLLWMEASTVPKIVRWRVLLQSFKFLVRHIAGAKNTVADFFSRMHSSPAEPALPIGLLHSLNPDVRPSPEDLLREVHGGRMPHAGARRTWLMLNTLKPGHRIPFRVVQDFVASCATCQKDRLGMTDFLEPVVRHLKPTHARSMVGVDTLTVTPADDNGNQYIIVVVNHFTKFTALYPAKQRDALSIARALFQYVCSYGLVDSLISDPGSEFSNEVVRHLTRWLGLNHSFSLVDRHESNGVEGTNKQILKHLRCLVFDERVLRKWSDPEQLSLIQYFLNSIDSSETGVIPYAAHFGTKEATYFKLPAESGDGPTLTQEFVKLLDENLKALRFVSTKFQSELASARTSATPLGTQNIFQPGDLVLWDTKSSSANLRESKLSPRFVGPYEVLEQIKNDVEVRHITRGNITKLHVERLKLFSGSMEEAKRVAQIDNDQYEIKRILTYSGNPELRSTVDFKVEFEDGSVLWLPFSDDLFQTQEYVRFCESRPELQQMVQILKISNKLSRETKAKSISKVKPGDKVFVNLRWFGHLWYLGVDLPDRFCTDFYVEALYGPWKSKNRKKISIRFPVFNEEYPVDNLFVEQYGSHFEIPDYGEQMASALVDQKFLKDFPQVQANLSQN